MSLGLNPLNFGVPSDSTQGIVGHENVQIVVLMEFHSLSIIIECVIQSQFVYTLDVETTRATHNIMRWSRMGYTLYQVTTLL